MNNERISKLEAQVAELTQQLKALSSFNTIPFNVEKAFKNRLTSDLQPHVTNVTDDFPANPLSELVDEGGSATYRVMSPPDYAIRLHLGGNVYVAIPGFDY